MDFNGMVNEIDGYLVNNNYVFSYGFNAVGKTRLSKALYDKYKNEEYDKINVLCYNAFLEDDFIWDNENCVFKINQSRIIDFIDSEGIYNDIISCFKNTINKNIEPRFLTEDNRTMAVEFIIPSGDSDSEVIKISKGEETIFKWVMFYVVLEKAIEILSDKKDDRSTDLFDDLTHVIIDDPVSSIDDYRIYTIAVQVDDLLKKIRDINSKHTDKINISILVTTHHALFFNILFNHFKKNDMNYKFIIKNSAGDYDIEVQNDNAIFSYHISVISELQDAISNNDVQKKHFNLMRSLTEKTACFLAKTKWQVLFEKFPKSKEFIDMLNSNSHGKYSETEMSNVTNDQANLLKEGLEWFLKQYHFGTN